MVSKYLSTDCSIVSRGKLKLYSGETGQILDLVTKMNLTNEGH